MAKSITTAWMWQEGDHTRGVNLNIEKKRLEWQEDLVGFGCSLMLLNQSIADFLENGANRYASPPEDILSEIHSAIESLKQS